MEVIATLVSKHDNSNKNNSLLPQPRELHPRIFIALVALVRHGHPLERARRPHVLRAQRGGVAAGHLLIVFSFLVLEV